MGNIRAYLLRRRELCAYVIAGVIVTGVNYTIYSILTVFCGLGISVSNISAWAVSVFVAFLLNKAFVFQKQDWSFKTMFHEGKFCKKIKEFRTGQLCNLSCER